MSELSGKVLNASFDGRIRLVGVAAPTEAKPGEEVTVSLVWRVEDPPGPAPKLKVFVHAVVPGGKIPAAQADHRLAPGEVPSKDWKEGDLLVDRFTLRLPDPAPAEELHVMAGLYEGRNRWPVDEGEHDGDDRVQVATVKLAGGSPAFPTAEAKKRKGAITIDGKLDEADWQHAPRLGPFVRYDGKTKVRFPTFARLLWDEENLYLAFEATDADVHTPYKERDDPLYNSEAVEIFIDADGDKDEYVEMQAAPNDLHFDAAFKGGPRKNFDTDWDHDYETKSTVAGTLNDGSDKDEGFVSEWRIPLEGLRDIPSKPAVGDEWRINLFRLDRTRRGGKVVRSEATAWSSPWSGDFHNLDRFGILRFAP